MFSSTSKAAFPQVWYAYSLGGGMSLVVFIIIFVIILKYTQYYENYKRDTLMPKVWEILILGK